MFAEKHKKENEKKRTSGIEEGIAARELPVKPRTEKDNEESSSNNRLERCGKA